MNNNNLFTYVLYLLLIGLVAIASYKACEMRKAQSLKEKEEAELQKTLRDLGYTETDSTDGGSTYVAADSTAANTAPAAKQAPAPANPDGIEDEEPKPTASQNSSRAAATPSATAKTPLTEAAAPKTEARKAPASSAGRYHVVAGSFTKMEGARRQMETLIKMGYREAEIGRYNSKYAVVIVKRTNSRSEATRIMERLGEKDVDARLVDSRRKR